MIVATSDPSRQPLIAYAAAINDTMTPPIQNR